MDADLVASALAYHRRSRPGKIAIVPTKPMVDRNDLSLAYSPGVAAPCLAIAADPSLAAEYTSQSNLVAVISNGTAVLGLGNIGALASKPVMEGKACLFKKFADIDVFDLEIDETDTEALIETIVRLEPTFGGINLEDIKAPECFAIEAALRERMTIPVFHDDQHGTAIVAAAAVLNALEIVAKEIGAVSIACSGAGAAATACLDILVGLGVDPAKVFVADSRGVVHVGREGRLDAHKARYARETSARTLSDIVAGADIFLGLSAAGALTADMVRTMAQRPVILAMANPEPEIRPELARAVRPDCIVGTGRSDYPNQVNNVLCFPFLFRGALDCGATTIDEGMKIAAARAIAALAKEPASDIVTAAYGGGEVRFGPDHLLPSAFDPRLIVEVASAVADAAARSGAALRPIADMAAYRAHLETFVYRSGAAMRPIFAAAVGDRQAQRQRIAFADGEDVRILKAADVAVSDHLARPVLVGDRETILARATSIGLRMTEGRDFSIEPGAGVRAGLRLVERGMADGLICGATGTFCEHLDMLREAAPHGGALAALHLVLLPDQAVFICDTHVNEDPDDERIAAITLSAADVVRRFGLVPRAALLSHSALSGRNGRSAAKMRRAAALITDADPGLAVETDLRADHALAFRPLVSLEPGAEPQPANLLVLPNLDAANIAFGLLKASAGQGISVGPILAGLDLAANILAPSVSVRGIVNMIALTAAEAAHRNGKERVAAPFGARQGLRRAV